MLFHNYVHCRPKVPSAMLGIARDRCRVMVRKAPHKRKSTFSVTASGDLMISGAIHGSVPRDDDTPLTYVCCFCFDSPKSATCTIHMQLRTHMPHGTSQGITWTQLTMRIRHASHGHC